MKKENLIILNQGMNGLWKISVESLYWFNFNLIISKKYILLFKQFFYFFIIENLYISSN